MLERCPSGSPPRMRGKLKQAAAIACFSGITPADAGKTRTSFRRCCPMPDHPRGCGENFPSVRDFHGVPGSPPRMRGKHYWAIFWATAPGITPADAGKTVPALERCRHPRDHPRGCGENRTQTTAPCTWAGSPPRMRGKHMKSGKTKTERRITPADAGKTCRCSAERSYRRDHPRGCGENFAGVLARSLSAGSPPRMRGKHPLTNFRLRYIRITPADAGKTTLANNLLR